LSAIALGIGHTKKRTHMGNSEVAWWFWITILAFTFIIVLPILIINKVEKDDQFKKQCEAANGVTVMPHKSKPICLAESAVIEIRSK